MLKPRMNRRLGLLIVAILSFGVSAQAIKPERPTSAQPFSVHVAGVSAGAPIPVAQALCKPTTDGKSEKVALPSRPEIRWSGAPKATKSFAVFMMDPDVPADFTDAGKEGAVIAADAPRQEFFHWGVVDISTAVNHIPGGASTTPLKAGRALSNDLDAAGYVATTGEYGGPCPPWNDARLHHYHFIVLALAETTAVDYPSAKAAFNALINSKALLATATVVGTYSLNPSLAP